MNRPASTTEGRLADLLSSHVREREGRGRSTSYERHMRYLNEVSASAGFARDINGEVHLHYPPVVPPPSEPERFVIEEDLEGYDLCPDPLKAGSAEEFVGLLSRYRLWAGSPSFREMQRRCRGAATASTFCKMLKKNEDLPAQHLVRAFIRGCAGNDEAVKRWITAWRRLQISLIPAEKPHD